MPQVVFQPGFDWDVRPEVKVLPLIDQQQLQARIEQIRAEWIRAAEEADADPLECVINLEDFFDCLLNDLVITGEE